MTYNIDVKWQKGVDDQKGDFAITSLEIHKFRNKVCFNELWYFIESQVIA